MPTSRRLSDDFPDPDPDPEPVKRLSLKLSESLHKRFKTACAATNREMQEEVRKLVEYRTRELEDQADLSLTARQTRKQPAAVERRLRALDRALACNHPTADIDRMLADIEDGRDLQ